MTASILRICIMLSRQHQNQGNFALPCRSRNIRQRRRSGQRRHRQSMMFRPAVSAVAPWRSSRCQLYPKLHVATSPARPSQRCLAEALSRFWECAGKTGKTKVVRVVDSRHALRGQPWQYQPMVVGWAPSQKHCLTEALDCSLRVGFGTVNNAMTSLARKPLPKGGRNTMPCLCRRRPLFELPERPSIPSVLQHRLGVFAETSL